MLRILHFLILILVLLAAVYLGRVLFVVGLMLVVVAALCRCDLPTSSFLVMLFLQILSMLAFELQPLILLVASSLFHLEADDTVLLELGP